MFCVFLCHNQGRTRIVCICIKVSSNKFAVYKNRVCTCVCDILAQIKVSHLFQHVVHGAHGLFSADLLLCRVACASLGLLHSVAERWRVEPLQHATAIENCDGSNETSSTTFTLLSRVYSRVQGRHQHHSHS